MNPRALARFRVTAEGADEFFHAAIVITCRRCDHSETVSNEDFEAGLDDLVVWAQEHKCPVVRTAPRAALAEQPGPQDLRHARRGDVLNGRPDLVPYRWRPGEAEREAALRETLAAIRAQVAREYAAELAAARG